MTFFYEIIKLFINIKSKIKLHQSINYITKILTFMEEFIIKYLIILIKNRYIFKLETSS